MEKMHNSEYQIHIHEEKPSPLKKKSKTEVMVDQINTQLPRPISDNKEFCGKKIKSSKMKFTWEFAFENGNQEEFHTIQFERSKISMRRILTHNDKVIWDSYGTMIGTFNYKFKLDNRGNYCLIKKENDYTIYINDVEFQKIYTLYYIQLVNDIKKPIAQEERKSYLELKNINRRNSDTLRKNDNIIKFRHSNNIKEAEDAYEIVKQDNLQEQNSNNYNPFADCVYDNSNCTQAPFDIKYTESQYIKV